MEQLDTVQNNDRIPEQSDIVGSVQIVTVLPTASAALKGVTYLLNGVMAHYTKSHFYQCVQDADGSYRWEDLLVGRFAVGDCTDIKISTIDDGTKTKVIMSWKDPVDTEIGRTKLYWWKTVLVHQIGHMPADLADGEIIETFTKRDAQAVFGSYSFEFTNTKKPVVHYFKLFPFSTEGAVNNNDSNGRSTGYNYVVTNDSEPAYNYDSGTGIKTYYKKTPAEGGGFEYKAMDWQSSNFDGDQESGWRFKSTITYYELKAASITWAGIRDLVRSGTVQNHLHLGDVIQLPYHGDMGVMSYEIVDFDTVEPADPNVHHTMTLVAKQGYDWWDDNGGLVFDAKEYAAALTKDAERNPNKTYFRLVDASSSSESETMRFPDLGHHRIGESHAALISQAIYGTHKKHYLFPESRVDMSGRDADFSKDSLYECDLPYLTQWGISFNAQIKNSDRCVQPMLPPSDPYRPGGYQLTKDETPVYYYDEDPENNKPTKWYYAKRPASGKTATWFVRIPFNSSNFDGGGTKDNPWTFKKDSSHSNFYYEELGFVPVTGKYRYGIKYFTKTDGTGQGNSFIPQFEEKTGFTVGDTIPDGVYVAANNVHSYTPFAKTVYKSAGDDHDVEKAGWNPSVSNCYESPNDKFDPNDDALTDRFIRAPYSSGSSSGHSRHFDDAFKWFIPVEPCVKRFKTDDGELHTEITRYLRDATSDIDAIVSAITSAGENRSEYHDDWSSTTTGNPAVNFDRVCGAYQDILNLVIDRDKAEKAFPMIYVPCQDEVYLPGKTYYRLEQSEYDSATGRGSFTKVTSGTKWTGLNHFFRKVTIPEDYEFEGQPERTFFVPVPSLNNGAEIQTIGEVDDLYYIQDNKTSGIRHWRRMTPEVDYTVGDPIPTISITPAYCLSKSEPDKYIWSIDGGVTECTKDMLGTLIDGNYTGYSCDTWRITNVYEPVIQRYYMPLKNDEVMTKETETWSTYECRRAEDTHGEASQTNGYIQPYMYYIKNDDAVDGYSPLKAGSDNTTTTFISGTTVGKWKEKVSNVEIYRYTEVSHLYWKVANVKRVDEGSHLWATSNLRMYLNGPFENGKPVGFKADPYSPSRYWNFGLSPVQQYVYNSNTQLWEGCFQENEYWWKAQTTTSSNVSLDRLEPRYAANFITSGNPSSSKHVIGNTGISRVGAEFNNLPTHEKYSVRCTAMLPRQSFLHGFLDCEFVRTNDQTRDTSKIYYMRTPYGTYDRLEIGDDYCTTPYKHCLYERNPNFTSDYMDAVDFLNSIVTVINRNGCYGSPLDYDINPQTAMNNVYGTGTTTYDKVWLLSKAQLAGGDDAVNNVCENNVRNAELDGNRDYGNYVYALKHYRMLANDTHDASAIGRSRMRQCLALGRHTATGYADTDPALSTWWLRTIHDSTTSGYDAPVKDPNALKVGTCATDGVVSNNNVKTPCEKQPVIPAITIG